MERNIFLVAEVGGVWCRYNDTAQQWGPRVIIELSPNNEISWGGTHYTYIYTYCYLLGLRPLTDVEKESIMMPALRCLGLGLFVILHHIYLCNEHVHVTQSANNSMTLMETA